MSKNWPVIVVVGVLVLIIGSFLYFKNTYTPKYSWFANYQRNSDQPYGLKLFYSFLKNDDQKMTVISDHGYETLDTSLVNTNFVYLGNDFDIDSITAINLIDYVAHGNTAFIACDYAPLELTRNFVPIGQTVYGYKEESDSIVHVQFVKDTVPYAEKMRFPFQYLKDTIATNWSGYAPAYFNDTLLTYDFLPLSYLNDTVVNCYYVYYGKGKIIVHSNPILFTNYYLVRPDGFKNVNNILSMLSPGHIFWDDPQGLPDTTNHAARSNPLKFLFSHPHLRWAWYLFLFTVLLYLLFRSKREQRIIPLLPVNTNTSIEYTKAIGTLYFQSKGQNHIANEIAIIFLAEVRSRYNIATDIPEEKLIDQLAVRSGVNKTILFNLFKQLKFVRTDASATADDLVNLYNSIDNYQKKRK